MPRTPAQSYFLRLVDECVDRSTNTCVLSGSIITMVEQNYDHDTARDHFHKPASERATIVYRYYSPHYVRYGLKQALIEV